MLLLFRACCYEVYCRCPLCFFFAVTLRYDSGLPLPVWRLRLRWISPFFRVLSSFSSASALRQQRCPDSPLTWLPSSASGPATSSVKRSAPVTNGCILSHVGRRQSHCGGLQRRRLRSPLMPLFVLALPAPPSVGWFAAFSVGRVSIEVTSSRYRRILLHHFYPQHIWRFCVFRNQA